MTSAPWHEGRTCTVVETTDSSRTTDRFERDARGRLVRFESHRTEVLDTDSFAGWMRDYSRPREVVETELEARDGEAARSVSRHRLDASGRVVSTTGDFGPTTFLYDDRGRLVRRSYGTTGTGWEYRYPTERSLEVFRRERPDAPEALFATATLDEHGRVVELARPPEEDETQPWRERYRRDARGNVVETVELRGDRVLSRERCRFRGERALGCSQDLGDDGSIDIERRFTYGAEYGPHPCADDRLLDPDPSRP